MMCVKCGKKEAIHKGLCTDCTWESAEISRPGSLSHVSCPKCGAVRVGNSWSHNHGRKHWEKKAIETFSINEPFKITGGEFIETNHRRDFIELKITASMDGDTREFSYTLPYSEDKISCPTCNKITGSYFEAKVQIRGMTGEITDRMTALGQELVNFVENNRKTDHESFISKVENVKDGIDIYLGKRKDGDTFAKSVKSRDICTVVVSNTLAGVRDGKQFFRFTYLVRILDYKPGSVLFINSRKYIYQGRQSGGLYLIDVEKEKEVFINKKSIDFPRIHATGEIAEKRRYVIISRQNSETTMMDKNNFSQITVKGEYGGEECDMFVLDGILFNVRSE